MSIAKKINQKYTFENYVAFEQESAIRHEFQDGVLFPIEATTKNHNTIITNFLLNAKIPQLRKKVVSFFTRTSLPKWRTLKEVFIPI